MKFILDHDKKVIIGWSAKCGCSHVKNMFLFLINKENQELHGKWANNRLPNHNISEYTVIIIIRNPFKRLVSGFINKYNYSPSEFYSRWPKQIPLTFQHFLSQILRSNWKAIDKHHFTPQISEYWKQSLLQHPKLHVFDIENIDYNLFEKLYNKKIPQHILDFRGPPGHINDRTKIYPKQDKVFEKLLNSYNQYKVPLKKFYTKEIIKIMKFFYKKDFKFATQFNFHYELSP